MKAIIIFGTRPEAIKMAPLFLAFKRSAHEVKVCVTAQHRQMLDQVLSFFEIVPDYDLDLMLPDQTLNSLAGRLFQSIDSVYEDFKPDWAFVHGDTTTSSICAWAAFHRGVKVAHVEAGLRTYNLKSPFPEELNRQITGRIADLHFAPTSLAEKNLLMERVPKSQIIVTGNTVIDALMMGLDKIDRGYNSEELANVKKILNPEKKIILVTGHRRENFGKGFEQICKALKVLAENKDIQIIYPVHLNPNVQKPVYNLLGNLPNIILLKPLDYPSFIYLMRASFLIVTDSGGIQEEAAALGKPVLVMRDTTERPEGIETGSSRLVGTSVSKIVEEASMLLTDASEYDKMGKCLNPYGDGKAVKRIISVFE